MTKEEAIKQLESFDRLYWVLDGDVTSEKSIADTIFAITTILLEQSTNKSGVEE